MRKGSVEGSEAINKAEKVKRQKGAEKQKNL